jgi:hypothetical protein
MPSSPLLALLALLAGAGPGLRPALLEQDEYAESFTFVADLDDGTYLQLQLAVTNLGPGSRTGLCRALVVRPGASAWTASTRVRESGWSHTATKEAERLQVGPCSVAAGPETEVRVELEGAELRLAFPAPLAPRDPPAPTVTVGEREHRTWLLLPFARASARLALPGQPPVALEGGGYADHSRSTVAAKQLARRWIRFRGLRGERRALLLARESQAGGFAPAWLWLEGREPRSFERFELTREEAGGAPRWAAALFGGVEGRILSGAQLYRHAPVEELGAIGRIVAPVVGSPVTWTSRATLQLPGEAPLAGILEVSLLED